MIIRVAFLMLVLVSCSTKKETKTPPPDVMGKDSLAYHLGNIHFIDAAMRHRVVRKQSLQAQAKMAFIEYFDTSGTSQQRFETSLAYWRDDFEAMDEIYAKSMEMLSMKLAKANPPESNPEDSTVIEPAYKEPKTMRQRMKEKAQRQLEKKK